MTLAWSWIAEEQTTYRAGDVIRLLSVCTTQEPVHELVRLTPEAGARRMAEFIQDGWCLPIGQMTPVPIPAMLVELVAGPFERGNVSVSIWQVEDISGDVGYVMVPDEGGEHEAWLAL